MPLSIQAFSAETLEAAGVSDALELQRLVPNFTAFRGTSVSNTQFRIRGIGAAGNTAVDQSVAVFLDGVYVARPSVLYSSFLDIAGVEVVRGPQGTLFGRNTTAGGVILRSGDPGYDLSFDGSAEYGAFGRSRGTAVANIPGSDQVRFRVALQAGQFDGYGENTIDGSNFGEQDSIAARVGIGLDFTDSLSLVLKFDHSHITGDGQTANEAMASSLGPTQLANLTARVGGAANLPDLSNPYDHSVHQIASGNLSDSQTGVSSNLTWDLDSGYTMRLISGWRDYDNTQTDNDVLFTPIPFLGRFGALRSTSYSHELQFISPTDSLLGGRLSYVAGLYFYHEDAEFDENLHLNANLCNTFLPPGGQRNACLTGPFTNTTVLHFTQASDSLAGYAQGDFAFTDTLSLQLGARLTSDDKDGQFVQIANNAILGALFRAPENTTMTFSEQQPTYRAGLNWTPTEDVLVFASYSTGYKAGGFNSGGGTPALGVTRRGFASEEATNYEVGIRSQFADGRVTLNATAYQTDLDGFQDRSFDGISFITRNAGSLRHSGVEFDGVVHITDNLRVNGAAAWLNSEFNDFTTASAFPGCAPATPANTPGCGPVVRTIQDLTGGTAHFAPDFQGSLQANYDHEFSSGWSLTLNGGLSHLGEQFVGGVTDNNPQTFQDAYTLWNARVSLFAPQERWQLAVFGENLTDEQYCTTMFYQPNDNLFAVRNATTGATMTRCNPGAPQTWGVSLSARF